MGQIILYMNNMKKQFCLFRSTLTQVEWVIGTLLHSAKRLGSHMLVEGALHPSHLRIELTSPHLQRVLGLSSQTQVSLIAMEVV